ncbi:MAG: hypothetical protein IPO78_16895 [Saprospiraceae bacterium]|nr:hypothetical protein [Saprospiraceae bacterium]
MLKNPEKANTFQKISTGASGADEMKLQQAKANYQDIAGGLAYTAPITSSKHVLKVGLSSRTYYPTYHWNSWQRCSL